MDHRFTLLDPTGAPLAADADTATAVAVLDSTTNLIWSRDNVASGRLDHEDATKACAELTLAGASDWRLPTIRELLSLVDYDRYEPAIDTDAFPSTKSNWYWTASPWAGSPSDFAWVVCFGNGSAYDGHRYGDAFVRAVRSVSSPGQ
jgi:hypothetical protein